MPLAKANIRDATPKKNKVRMVKRLKKLGRPEFAEGKGGRTDRAWWDKLSPAEKKKMMDKPNANVPLGPPIKRDPIDEKLAKMSLRNK